MSKATMLEPVVWGVYNPTMRIWELSKERVETKHREDGTVVYAVVPFITTTQAEAYAAAKVREALEEAAEIADQMNAFSVYDAIRALIPEEKE